METNVFNIYNQFVTCMNAGDEVGARKIVIDNYNALPEDVQANVLLALVTEATDKARGEEILHDLRTRAVAMLERLEHEEDSTPPVVNQG